MPVVSRSAFVLAAALLACFARAAAAQRAGAALPGTVRIVVPFTPGGSADVIARLIAQEAGKAGGQTWIVENRPGAGTIIGTEAVARSAPDGGTLLMMSNSFIINAHVRASLPYDPLASFEPTCLVVNSPQLIAVNAHSPLRTLGDLVAAARVRPGELSYASVGPATTQHILGETLRRAAKIEMTYVPFPGGAPAVNALLGGHVTAVVANYSELLEQLQAGTMRPLAVASRERLAALPEVPTLAESGFPNLETTAFFGLVAPAKTPPEAIGQLIGILRKAIEAPEIRGKLDAQGLYPAEVCGADFAARIRTQYDSYGRAAQEANIKVR